LIDFVFLGAVNVPADQDGVTRRVPLVVGFEFPDPVSGEIRAVFIPSFSLLAAMHYLDIEHVPSGLAPVEVWMGDRIELRAKSGRVIRIPIDDLGRMRLNFDARDKDFQSVPFAEVAPSYLYSSESSRAKLAARMRSRIEGKLAVVGMVATGTTDIGATPLSEHTPNVVVHLQAISNILGNSFIAPLSRTARRLGMGGLLLVFTGICLAVRSARLPLAGLGAVVLILMAAYLSLHASLAVIPVLQPVLYVALCTFSVVSYRYVTEIRDRRTIRRMFSRMVSAEVLNYMEEHPQGVSLEGHHAEVTVFFSDVQSFAPISERLSAHDLVRVMNMYFKSATDCIMERRGYINKFVGDEIMAVWGAPAADLEHPVHACLAALDQQRALVALNRDLQESFGIKLGVRMGLNSGEVVAGPMGSERRMEYTVMGDVVNVAARLEPANKLYGTAILIGSSTADRVADQLVVRRVDRLMVAGKTEAQEIYELVGEPSGIDDTLRRALTEYEKALAHYFRRDWSAASRILEKIASTTDDQPTRVLLARLQGFESAPPPEDWGGVFLRPPQN
jgi:adenylate cyclase